MVANKYINLRGVAIDNKIDSSKILQEMICYKLATNKTQIVEYGEVQPRT